MKTLRAKFIFWICSLFILMGALIFIPLSIMLPEKISAQILKRDIRIAQYLSREVQEPLLMNNRLELRLLLEDRLENLGDVIYIFIRGHDGGIVSSTFKNGFPRGLLAINPLTPGRSSYGVKEFSANGKKGYDIAVPLLKGELGSLHMGVSLESSKSEIAEFARMNYYVGMIIFTGLGIGILIFALLGIFLSNRIIRLKDFAAKVGGGDLEGRIYVSANDEIGALAEAFNDMASSLKEKIREINRLNIIEERNRIALDLHDGCAQELASIIKNLELCEKLFKLEPAGAIEELKALKGSVKCILDKTRRTIFDLKPPEDEDFGLTANINNYINTYQKDGNIHVTLESSGHFSFLSPDESKQIFYIIAEALTNIKKHSMAKNVSLRLECNDGHELSLDIRDDGQGFDINNPDLSGGGCRGLGLSSMRQRAASLGGSLLIDSVPNGGGTYIHVNIPLAKRESGLKCQTL